MKKTRLMAAMAAIFAGAATRHCTLIVPRINAE